MGTPDESAGRIEHLRRCADEIRDDRVEPPSAFERTTPDALAHTISDLVRRATIQVRSQAAELMRPLTEGLPDLSDLSEGAPSLSDLVPKIPDYPAPEPGAEPIMTSAPRPVSPGDDGPETWLTR
jgi:hypothetical protein